MIRLFETRTQLYDEVLPKNGIGAELGVADGTNAHDLLRYAAPRKLFLCDPWPDSYIDAVPNQAKVKMAFAAEERVEIVRAWDHEWIASLDPSLLDWAYIDTDHTYETTTRELNGLRGKVRHIIAGHDFCCTASTLHPVVSEWNGGVMRAVIEAIQDGWLELVALTSPKAGCSAMDGFPSWACRLIG